MGATTRGGTPASASTPAARRSSSTPSTSIRAPPTHRSSPPGYLFGERERCRYLGLVTNRDDLGGEELIHGHREKCGTVEYMHDLLKNDLGARTFPSGQIGANAAWYRLAILAGNLAAALQRLVLGGPWERVRVATFRYRFLRLAGRVAHHARQAVRVLASTTLNTAALYAAAWAALAGP